MRARWMLSVWLSIPGAACGASGDRDAPDANEVTTADAPSDTHTGTALGADSVATAPDAPDAPDLSETAVSDTQAETVADVGPDPYGDLPILQRPLAPGAVTCTAERALGFALPGYFPTFELADGPPGAPFEHYMMGASRGFEPIYTVQLAPLDGAGALLPAIYSKELGEGYLGAFAAIASGDAFALAWYRGSNNPPVTLARVGTDGALQAGPVELAGTAGYIVALALESRADGGLALLWHTYDDAWRAVFRMARFSSDGTPVGEVATLVAGDPNEPEDTGMAYAMRPDGGVVVAWARGKDGLADLRVAAFDAAGAPLGAPIPLASTSGHAAMPALVRHGEGFVLAWVEREEIRVVRLDAEARPVGASVALGPAPGPPTRWGFGQPTWLAAGARVVLAWAMPDHFATAGGGVYPLGWVLLDPATLVPASNLLSFEDASFRDGIRDGAISHVRMTADGLDFHAYYQLQYHAGSSAGAARIACVPAP